MPSRPRLSLILIAFVAFISLGLPDGGLGVAWPSIQATFNLPVSQLGSLLAATTCGYLISSFSSGAAVRRLGVGHILLGSSVLVALASVGYALAPAWPVIVAMGVVLGMGSGAIDAGLNAYAAQHFSPRLVNWLHAFFGIGATFGPLLMTGVLAAGLGWRWGYGVNAILLAGMCICFLFTLRLWETPVAGEELHPVEQAPSPKTTETLFRPVVLLSMLTFVLYTGLEVTAAQWTYSLFIKSRGIDPNLAGVWIGVYWASLTVGRVLFGAATAHVSPLVVMRIATLGAPLGAMLIWTNISPLASFLGLALMGFCFAPIFPLMIAMTPGRVGRTAAHQAVGFQMSAGCIGVALIPGLIGVLARWAGLEIIGPALLVVSVVLLVVHEMIVRVAAGQARESPVPAPA